MHYRSKYIIIDTGTFVIPVIFSELQQHFDVAHALGGLPDKVLGAGFCHIDITIRLGANAKPEPRYVCSGESISLKVKSRGDEDARILNKYLGVIQE